MKRRVIERPLCLMVIVSAGFLVSCERSYHQKTERYIFVASNISLPYWQEAKLGFGDALNAMQVKGDFDGPDTYSPDEELALFQKAVASHPSGILLAPARPDLFNAAINDAVKQGIPVIALDSDAPDSERTLFIGTDNHHAGMESGEHIAQLLHGEGNVVIIGITGQLNQDERIRGAKEALSKYSKIKINSSVIDDQGDPRKANDGISDLLAKKEKLDGILCLEASGGPGTAEALHRLNMEGKIVVAAFDKNPETLDWIGSGVIAGTVAQKPYTMAYYGVRLLDDLNHNIVREFKDWRTAPASPLPTRIDTGTAWVDKSNLDAFKAAEPSRVKSLGGNVKDMP